MASSKFNMIQVALQSAFGTPIAATAMTTVLPWRGTYEDKRHRHVVERDAGTWTPTTIVAQVATEVALTVEGTAFFELIPVLLNSGLSDATPTGSSIHNYWVNPAAVGVPLPLTALVGTVGTLIGATGPAVQLSDLYLKTLTLSANINDKVVKVKGDFFGTTYNDNSAAGWAFDASGCVLPATMEVINGLKGKLNYDDATTTGFAEGIPFEAGLTAFSCVLLDWEWTLDTGIEPAWCLTDNVTTWSTLKYTSPSCTFKPVMRTNATTYAQVKKAADEMTYQNLQLQLAGSDAGRSLSINMTGLWDVVPTAHDEQDGEVVIKPTFTTQTSHLQTTAAHWLTIINTSKHAWSA
jgi:hypothetical protein